MSPARAPIVFVLALAAAGIWGYVAFRVATIARAPAAVSPRVPQPPPAASAAPASAAPYRGDFRDPFERVPLPARAEQGPETATGRTAAPVAPAAVTAPFELVGIVGDAALVRTPGGRTHLLRAGESLGGATLETVGGAWIAVRVAGHALRLRLDGPRRHPPDLTTSTP